MEKIVKRKGFQQEMSLADVYLMEKYLKFSLRAYYNDNNGKKETRKEEKYGLLSRTDCLFSFFPFLCVFIICQKRLARRQLKKVGNNIKRNFRYYRGSSFSSLCKFAEAAK